MPWYRSNVLRSLAVSTVAQILSRFHVTAQFVPDAGAYVDTALDIISLCSLVYAGYVRSKGGPLPALVASKAKADVANAAVAVAAPPAPVVSLSPHFYQTPTDGAPKT
jgi:hypothetical protein